MNNTVIKQSCFNQVLHFSICYSISSASEIRVLPVIGRCISPISHLKSCFFQTFSTKDIFRTDIVCNFYSSVHPHHRVLRSAEASEPLHNPWVQCIRPCPYLQCQPGCNRNQLDKLPGDMKSQMHYVLLPADFFFQLHFLKEFFIKLNTGGKKVPFSFFLVLSRRSQRS